MSIKIAGTPVPINNNKPKTINPNIFRNMIVSQLNEIDHSENKQTGIRDEIDSMKNALNIQNVC